MKTTNVLELLKHIIFQISADGTIFPITPQAKVLLDSIPKDDDPLEVLFGTHSVQDLITWAQSNTSHDTTLNIGDQSTSLRWESMESPSQPGMVICSSIEWQPLQEMLQQVQQESLLFKELVLNILPHHVAKSLIFKKGVRPKAYRNCTVLFADVVSFSRVSFHLDPVSLIRRLNAYFSLYDELMVEFGLEKIKTIGDAYMCVSGLPNKKASHAVDCALASLGMLHRAQALEKKPHMVEGLDLNNWQIRIGIHSGPCISGVVGSQKFVFDIWGDSVNVASRMESASKAGQTNISVDTYQLIKDFFQCSPRGSHSVKNIGEVEMYFLERIKPELSADDAGTLPNELFLKTYCSMFRVNASTPNLSIYPIAVQKFVG